MTETAGRGAPVPPGPILEARGVIVRFGGITALDGVSLSVDPGSVVGLVGPNGAGKTTLFNVLSGLQRATGGEVHFNGRRVDQLSARRRVGLGIARTFQHSDLFTELTVREHFVLAYRARRKSYHLWSDLLGLGRRRGDARELEVVDGVIEGLNLGDVADTVVVGLPLPIGRLVEVGRALASEPSVVFLDEPSAGLSSYDTRVLGEMFEMVRRDHGVALVLVEHDVDFVLGLSDRVYVLDYGKVLEVGTPEEIRGSDVVREAYLGNAAVPERGMP